ncbi:oligopeptide/dipeptide ABC transporter ATP-binding protein [Paenibacillus ehimensis]|uniref:oligopeptide/dipeptide ABC transporter ATP-binding protein n=1 Tax=Paenibacillus ehimensis TaxID=79264 RepID=UPI000685CCFB|nr:ABC transporter ATP-binding protein [Paenibacillus ehimensis]
MRLIESQGLTKIYKREGRWFSSSANEAMPAVDRVSLHVEKGETLGLVGESGSGKSTLARLLLGLEKATEGRLLFRGEDMTRWGFRRLRNIRGRMQMVFQNSYSSFDPLFTVEKIVGEPLSNYGNITARERRRIVLESLDMVGLGAAYAGRYPHELSGGQLQRVNIARALVLQPELLVCDEPFSSLDFKLRRQILTLLEELKRRLGLSYLFITHDLSAVSRFCDRVAVMYRGQIVETLPGARIAEEALHPYTRSLLDAVPVQDPRLRRSKTGRPPGEPALLRGDNIIRGCRFCSRCPAAMPVCYTVEPALERKRPSHQAACHLYAHEAEGKPNLPNC